MNPILYIKGGTIKDVRIQKFISFFDSKSIDVFFLGWDRVNNEIENDKINYLLSRGGYNNKFLMLFYPLWVFIVFIKALFYRDIPKYNVICINFECGLPIYLASKIRKIEYIYEIYDEFSISHNFPNTVKRVLSRMDRKIMKNAKFVIHVDENRVNYDKCKSIIIENSPYDFYQNRPKDYDVLEHSFAIIGNISKTRGIDQIYLFAKDTPHVNFILAGTFYDTHYNDLLLSLSNVVYYDRMPQDDLFKKIEICCAIFSLYDTSLDINRLAASNKVYDAMMSGIPVLTNPDVVNSKFIKEQKVGIIINYTYDSTWKQLSSPEFLKIAKEIGKKGRHLYESNYRIEVSHP
jgi:hypothetical protein